MAIIVGIFAVVHGISRFKKTGDRHQLVLTLAGLASIAFGMLHGLTRLYFQGEEISSLLYWTGQAIDIAVPVLWIYCLLKLTRREN
jgi:hypothetical protein